MKKQGEIDRESIIAYEKDIINTLTNLTDKRFKIYIYIYCYMKHIIITKNKLLNIIYYYIIIINFLFFNILLYIYNK